MTETYSVSVDFSSGVIEHQLQAEIVANTTITTTLLRIERTNDVLDVVFNAAISGAEGTELDTLITNHVPADLDHTKISIAPAETTLGDANTTLTITQINTQIVTMTPTVDRTITLPTAASMSVNLINTVDNSIKFRIINLDDANDANITIQPTAGCIGVGHMDVAPPHNTAGTYHYSGTGVFKLRLTNASAGTQAYTVYRVS